MFIPATISGILAGRKLANQKEGTEFNDCKPIIQQFFDNQFEVKMGPRFHWRFATGRGNEENVAEKSKNKTRIKKKPK